MAALVAVGPKLKDLPSLGDYPKKVTLPRSGVEVTIRPLEGGDAHELLKLFLRLPWEEHRFLRDDVTSPVVVSGWVHGRDYDQSIPLVAVANGELVADATLHRREAKADEKVGEIRIVVDPRHRNQGLGALLVRELMGIAGAIGLERVVLELVEGGQQEAVKLAERLGFTRVGATASHVTDVVGTLRGLVTMERTIEQEPDESAPGSELLGHA